MKRFLTVCSLLLAFFLSGYSQTPQYVPYQAVARTSAGNLMQTAAICVQFKIYNAASGGTLLYSEHQSVTTNTLGLFNVNIGNGTNDGGSSTTLGGVSWGASGTYMEVWLSTSGCSGYAQIGSRTQMMSVPYALYAGNAASVPSANLTESTSNILTITGGSNSVVSASGTTIQVKKATASQDGYLSSTDWTTFNNKLTSVGLALPSTMFSVSGSPLTGAGGTITGSFNSQSANQVFASPDGSAGTPLFRALTAADLPSLSAGYIQNQTASAQSAGFNINGNGTIGGKLAVTGTASFGGPIGVGILIPNSSAIADLTSTTSGFLPPRMTQAQRNAIATPAQGLMIFNTDNQCIDVNVSAGTANWVETCPCNTKPAAPGTITNTTTGGNICINTTYTFTVAQVTSAQYYVWAITNGTILSGQGTNTITASFTSNAGTLNVYCGNACGATSTTNASITFNNLGSLPTISGYTMAGATQAVQYQLTSAVSNATGYAWGVSSGATASGSSTTATITYGGTIGSSAAYTISCTVSGCANSSVITLGTTAGGKAVYYVNPYSTTLTGGGSTLPDGAGGDQYFPTAAMISGYTFSIPTLLVKLWGAGGGAGAHAGGGSGGYVSGTWTSLPVAVTPTANLYKVVVGMGGFTDRGNSGYGTMYGGGGSDGIGGYTTGSAGCGGGRAAINYSGTDYVTAGGGGGGGASNASNGQGYGGAGGATTGGTGGANGSGGSAGTGGQAGTGGTGVFAGSQYSGGNGGNQTGGTGDGGGAGGGWWGGGGGFGSGSGNGGSGGGGGSNHYPSSGFAMSFNSAGNTTTGNAAAAVANSGGDADYNSSAVTSPTAQAVPNSTPGIGGGYSSGSTNGGQGEVVIEW